MLPMVSFSKLEIPTDLGKCYFLYRWLTACALSLLLFNAAQQMGTSLLPDVALYHYSLILYIGLNLLQLFRLSQPQGLTKYALPHPHAIQHLLYLDLIAFSLCALSLQRPELILGIIAANSIVVASLTANRKRARLMTFVISLMLSLPAVYLAFVDATPTRLLSSSLAVLLMFGIYVLSQQLKQSLQRFNLQYQQQNKLAHLGMQSIIISHEIRNPLAIIVQANDLARRIEDGQADLLHNMIAQQAQRIDHVIRDTLDTMQNKRCFRTQINLNNFIPSLLQQDLPDIQYAIQCEIEPELQIIFDELQLRQVLINLIRNAIHHNAIDAAFIQLKLYATATAVMIEIVDFGTGINEKNIAQLFKTFFSTEKKGTGLGLYLSQQYCEQNQVKLTHVKLKQRGTCFRMECPRIT